MPPVVLMQTRNKSEYHSPQTSAASNRSSWTRKKDYVSQFDSESVYLAGCTGCVQYWNDAKCYGFITSDNAVQRLRSVLCSNFIIRETEGFFFRSCNVFVSDNRKKLSSLNGKLVRFSASINLEGRLVAHEVEFITTDSPSGNTQKNYYTNECQSQAKKGTSFYESSSLVYADVSEHDDDIIKFPCDFSGKEMDFFQLDELESILVEGNYARPSEQRHQRALPVEGGVCSHSAGLYFGLDE